jgi:hypothetical protein
VTERVSRSVWWFCSSRLAVLPVIGDEAAAALAALLRSLGFEMVTVVFEQPPAT